MIEFVVQGKPVAQGSMFAVPNRRGGKPIIKPSNESKLKAWRKKIRRAAQMTGKEAFSPEAPIRLTVTFWLMRPKSVKREKPTVRQDTDKLVRAIGDGVTGVLLEDDAQITTIVAMKRYAEGRECAVIRLEEDV